MFYPEQTPTSARRRDERVVFCSSSSCCPESSCDVWYHKLQAPHYYATGREKAFAPSRNISRHPEPRQHGSAAALCCHWQRACLWRALSHSPHSISLRDLWRAQHLLRPETDSTTCPSDEHEHDADGRLRVRQLHPRSITFFFFSVCEARLL